MVVFMAMTIMACTKQIQMHVKNNSKLYINFMKFLISIEEGMIQPYLFHVKNLTNFIWQNAYNKWGIIGW